MARLEIELAVVGSDKLKKGIDNANSGLSAMQSILDKTKDSFSKANASALSLEKELNDLNKQLSSGAISSEKFAKEQSEIVSALSSSRQAAQAYQAQITSINATINKGVTRLDAFGTETKKLAGYHSSFASGIRSSNSVAIEFNRIIQDAPFGMIGIGNNLQQLVSNYQQYATSLRNAAAEQGKSITSGQILKGALGGIISPVNLLTLGVSAVTAAWTAYTLWAQKSEKATKDTKKSADEYVNSLSNIEGALLRGTQNGQKEVSQLKVLYSLYQNANIPLNKRREAYDELQKQYPSYFGDLAFEEVATKKTTAAYNSLTQSVIATAKAKALSARIGESAVKQEEIANKIFKLSEDLKKSRASDTSLAGALGGSNETRKILDEIYALDTDRLELRKEDLRVQEKINSLIAKENASLSDIKGSKKSSVKNTTNRSDTIVARSEATSDLSGLTGVDREVETIRQRYIKLYNDLSVNAKKSADARKSFEVDLNKLQANEANEISTIIISEQQRVANEIQRINNESGIASNENRAKELAAVQKWYDAEILKARDSAEIIASIEEGKTARIDSINNKYEAKRLDQQTKLNDKIASLAGKDFTLNERFSNRITAKNKEALNERLKDVEKHFEELRKLNATNPLALLALGVAEGGIKQDITGKANTANNAGSSRIFKDLANSFTDEIVGSLRNIKREADQTFGSVIGKLGTGLLNGLNNSVTDIFVNQFKNQFSKAITDASSKLSIGLQGAIAGAGLLGGAISGLTKKTSGAGQGIGGAISGAATGAALGSIVPGIGTAIGAVAGGLVGLFGGIFGAKKARKEEAIQAAQLAEQKKQTALQERANALAYSASIIGQQTNQGIVTGVERDATGNLVAKIAGKDILITYERALADKKRGIA